MIQKVFGAFFIFRGSLPFKDDGTRRRLEGAEIANRVEQTELLDGRGNSFRMQ